MSDNLACIDKFLHRPNAFFDGNSVIGPGKLIEVDVFSAKTPQATLGCGNQESRRPECRGATLVAANTRSRRPRTALPTIFSGSVYLGGINKVTASLPQLPQHQRK